MTTGMVEAGESMWMGGRVGFSNSSPSSSARLPREMPNSDRPGLIFGAGKKIELLAWRSSSRSPDDRGVGGGKRRMRTSPVMPAAGGELSSAAAWLFADWPGMLKASRKG